MSFHRTFPSGNDCFFPLKHPPVSFLSKSTACDCYGYLSSPAHHMILLLILMMIVCGIWNTSACATVSFNSIPGSAQKWSPLMFVLVHIPTHPDSVSATKKCELDDQPRRYLCSMNECWWNSHLGPTNLHIPFHVSSFTAFRSSPALLCSTHHTNQTPTYTHIWSFCARPFRYHQQRFSSATHTLLITMFPPHQSGFFN